MSEQKLPTLQRKNQIAQAILDLIAASSIDELSISAVARKVGLVPSALYRHFHNKDAMLDAVLDLIRGRLLANVETSQRLTDNPIEQLHALLRRHIRLIQENQAIPRIVFSESIFSGHEERKSKVYAIIQLYLAHVRSIIEQGQSQNLIRKDMDPSTLAVMFLSLIQPSAILWYLSDGNFDAFGHSEKAWRVFAQAIQAGAIAPDKSRKTKEKKK